MLTWDDGVQCTTITEEGVPPCDPATNLPEDLRYLIHNLTNPNGSPYHYTFFTTQQNTEYDIVENVYANGHEVAGHTITHGTDRALPATEYFKTMDKNASFREVVGQRNIITSQTNLPAEAIAGYRIPDLATNEAYYEVLNENGFTYDSSLGVRAKVNPEGQPGHAEPLWPFTLDWSGKQGSLTSAGSLPEKAYRGLWEVPINPLFRPEQDCASTRTCTQELAMYPFAGSDADTVKRGLEHNFDRYYNGNRAPLGIFLHTAWLINTNVDEGGNVTGLTNQTKVGLRAFLEGLQGRDDVWVVTPAQVIRWMQASQSDPAAFYDPGKSDLFNPPVDRPPARCDVWYAGRKRPQDDKPLGTRCSGQRPTNWGTQCMNWGTCNSVCPNRFPWFDNPSGEGSEVESCRSGHHPEPMKEWRERRQREDALEQEEWRQKLLEAKPP
jgi:hypothetical protein